ncbi:MAG: hypothetical protein QOC54_662 [Baekduia sp.]|jgi:hypothetical protein|nr:hypothetical protein [Baekduia sp.]
MIIPILLGLLVVALVAGASSIRISVDKNSTDVFPAPLMSTIQELGAFLARETTAIGGLPPTPPANGHVTPGATT